MADNEEAQIEVARAEALYDLDELQAQNAALRQQLDEALEAKGTRGIPRRPLSIAAAIIGAIFLPIAVITVWTHNTLLDTDEYVATVAPLAEDENIQEAISFRVTEQVAEAADFKSIAQDALPPNAQVLAAPIEAGAKNLIAETVEKALATPQFADLWEASSRQSHEALLPLIEGRSTDLIGTEEGRVVLKLGSVAEDALGRVDEAMNTTLVTQIPPEQLEAEIVLIESKELAQAQGLARFITRMSWLSLILAVAFLAGAFFLSENRRVGVRRLGLAIAVPMVLCVLAYAWARSQYLAGLPSDVHNPAAAEAVFDILTAFLLRAFRAMLVLGALLVIGAWVAGPSSAAAKVRESWDTLLGRASASGEGREPGPITRSIANNEHTLLTVVAALGALTLVIWSHPTGLAILFVAIVTLAVMGFVRIAAEVARRGDTPAEQESSSVSSG